MKRLLNKVAKIISNHFEIDTDKVTDELNIKDDLKADSISIMKIFWNLKMSLEQKFLTKMQNKLKQLVGQLTTSAIILTNHQHESA